MAKTGSSTRVEDPTLPPRKSRATSIFFNGADYCHLIRATQNNRGTNFHSTSRRRNGQVTVAYFSPKTKKERLLVFCQNEAFASLSRLFGAPIPCCWGSVGCRRDREETKHGSLRPGKR